MRVSLRRYVVRLRWLWAANARSWIAVACLAVTVVLLVITGCGGGATHDAPQSTQVDGTLQLAPDDAAPQPKGAQR